MYINDVMMSCFVSEKYNIAWSNNKIIFKQKKNINEMQRQGKLATTEIKSLPRKKTKSASNFMRKSFGILFLRSYGNKFNEFGSKLTTPF
jgi:hypothetical protein